jgi:hypothetical protein
MALTVVVHIQGSDAIMAEIEKFPDPRDNFLDCTNPRARDGKAIVYIDHQATHVMFPWQRISFVETLPSDEDQGEIESFFRD